MFTSVSSCRVVQLIVPWIPNSWETSTKQLCWGRVKHAPHTDDVRNASMLNTKNVFATLPKKREATLTDVNRSKRRAWGQKTHLEQVSNSIIRNQMFPPQLQRARTCNHDWVLLQMWFWNLSWKLSQQICRTSVSPIPSYQTNLFMCLVCSAFCIHATAAQRFSCLLPPNGISSCIFKILS